MPINVKMPTVVGIMRIIYLCFVELSMKKSFITSGPGHLFRHQTFAVDDIFNFVAAPTNQIRLPFLTQQSTQCVCDI